MKNIIETVSNHSNLKIFLNAILETGLYDVLARDGPFTLFAPTDTAFRKLPNKLIEQLFQDKEELTELLTQHIVLIKMKSTDMQKNNSIQTANGKKISFSSDNGYKIDGVRVIKRDIVCKNGIIHTINEVLLSQGIIKYIGTNV
jgi:uncharacterized surface protein with fasciclin (FAS1) repeats